MILEARGVALQPIVYRITWVFFMKGRVVATSIGLGCHGYHCVPFATKQAGFTLFSDVAMMATNVSAYHVLKDLRKPSS